MKLSFLDIEKFSSSLTPVTSTIIKKKNGEFHENGLFSEAIFGLVDTLDRKSIYSYIDLNQYIITPPGYKILKQLNRKIDIFLSGENKFKLDKNNTMVESDDDEGYIGIKDYMNIFKNINYRGGTSERRDLITLIKNSYDNNVLFINKIPVIPPDFRPMFEDNDGRIILDQLNEYYIDIMRKANQIKTIDKKSEIYNILLFYLQMSVNKYDDFLRQKISRKNGIIRDNILGKRVDFSGRGIITPNPKLKIDEIGVPLKIAVSLFEPFIIHYIFFSNKFEKYDELDKEFIKYNNNKLSINSLKEILKGIRKNAFIPEKIKVILSEVIEIVMINRYVITKRDPVLNIGSYRAFKPKLSRGNSIQLSTMVTGSFNADFDGDQMAIFHPLTEESQEEIKEKMTRIYSGKNINDFLFSFSKEMCVGLYTITKNVKVNGPFPEATDDMIKNGTDPYIPVRYKNKNTTLGKAIFNSVFPYDFPFINDIVTKKYINNMILKIYKLYGEEKCMEIFSELKNIGFKFATIMSPTLSLDMIELPPDIEKLRKEIKKEKSPVKVQKLIDEATKKLKEYLKDTGLYDLVDSGSSKGWDQPIKILISKGLISDPTGKNIIKIGDSLSDGLDTVSFFNASPGARKGIIDRVLNTAKTGYLTRILVYALGNVELHPTLRDCKTNRYISIKLNNDNITRLYGRYIIENNKLVLFDKSKYKNGDVIKMRTPIYCKSEKICHTCYGQLSKIIKTPYIGIFSGSIIGERGTQLIMRTFHTGGAISITKHNILKSIYENDSLINFDLTKFLMEEKNKLITLDNCKLYIDTSDYEKDFNIKLKNDDIWVNHLISKIEYDKIIFNVILDSEVIIKLPYDYIEDDNNIIIEYKKNDTILEIPLTIDDLGGKMNYLNRLLNGKIVFKNVEHLLNKIFNIYKKMSIMDYVHFEILLSNILRYKNDISLPARLGKRWNPIIINIKNIVFETGFVEAIAFENINKAVIKGLTKERSVEESLIGKIMSGDIK